MCTVEAVSCLPKPADGILVQGAEALYFGNDRMPRTLAILPDIYGCNAFYRGLATYFSGKGMGVFLMNPFAEFGELSEVTREAAFERRNKVRDRAYVDRLERFIKARGIAGVIGFCLGGLYVMDLARRGVTANLVAMYPFPQGLQNVDPLPVPFSYLEDMTTPLTVHIGDEDDVVGRENIAKLETVAAKNPRLSLHVYRGSGHGLLADLDSTDLARQRNAQNALELLSEAAAASGSRRP